MKKAFNVTIESELIARMKSIAALDEQRLSRVVEAAFRDYIAKKAKAKP